MVRLCGMSVPLCGIFFVEEYAIHVTGPDQTRSCKICGRQKRGQVFLIPVVKLPAKELENSGAGMRPVGVDDQVPRVRCHVAQFRGQVTCFHRFLQVRQTEGSLCRVAGKALKVIENADGRYHVVLCHLRRIRSRLPFKKVFGAGGDAALGFRTAALVRVEASLASNRFAFAMLALSRSVILTVILAGSWPSLIRRS